MAFLSFGENLAYSTMCVFVSVHAFVCCLCVCVYVCISVCVYVFLLVYVCGDGQPLPTPGLRK